MKHHMGVSEIQSNHAQRRYGDIRNKEQAIVCAIWCFWAQWAKITQLEYWLSFIDSSIETTVCYLTFVCKGLTSLKS